MGSIVKRIRKIIPKEVRPAVPFVAAYYGGPALGAKLGIKSAAASKALTAALASKAQGDDTDIALRSAALAATPDLLQSGLDKIGTKFTPQTAQALKASLPVTGGGSAVPLSQQLGSLATAASESDLMTSLVSPKGQTLGAQAKALAIPTAIEGAAQLAEIQQDQIDAYNRQLQEQGVMNKLKRRQGIYDIYINAGYDPDYVNSVLDKYGYADGGIAYLANGGLESDAEEMLKRFSTGFRNYKGKMKPMKAMFGKKKKKKTESVKTQPDEKGEITVNIEGSEGDDGFLQSLQTAREGIEMAYKPPIGSVQAAPMMKFAEGGEVEEGIMSKIADSMGDDYDYFTRIKIRENLKQGETMEDAADLAEQEAMNMVRKKYGFAKGGEVEEEVEESGIMMASSPNNFAELNMLAIDLFGRPYDQLTDGEQETLMDFIGSKSQAGGKGIMQMASGYKSDIEEMYEQYVFEMEEMGLQPMSFSEFLARERAGMEDGGKVQRRKKGEPADEVIEDEEEIFIDNMPRPKRQGIMEAADGGIMEKDMRGGGFIPEGSKERADDVPARLSKNEFVMTADAVRAAGGGSINKGAKRMYDMMYSLEGKI